MRRSPPRGFMNVYKHCRRISSTPTWCCATPTIAFGQTMPNARIIRSFIAYVPTSNGETSEILFCHSMECFLFTHSCLQSQAEQTLEAAIPLANADGLGDDDGLTPEEKEIKEIKSKCSFRSVGSSRDMSIYCKAHALSVQIHHDEGVDPLREICFATANFSIFPLLTDKHGSGAHRRAAGVDGKDPGS
jgi:hypothetical protein